MGGGLVMTEYNIVFNQYFPFYDVPHLTQILDKWNFSREIGLNTTEFNCVVYDTVKIVILLGKKKVITVSTCGIKMCSLICSQSQDMNAKKHGSMVEIKSVVEIVVEQIS